jgi:uncharacterized membrane protein
VRRALQLLALGTLLQLPRTSLYDVFTQRDLFVSSFRPGALQLVASGLLLAEGLRRATKTRLAFGALAAILALSIALVAPLVWNARLSELLALGGWLDGQAGSQFPLVPWLGFFFLGAALAGFFGRSLWLQGCDVPRSRRWMPIVGTAGILVSALGYVAFLRGVRLTSLYGSHSFWYSNPLFFAFRAGLACAWLGLLTASERLLFRTFSALPRVARVIRALAKHSLVAYVVHLVLLYGTPWFPGLARGGPQFGALETIATFACVSCATIGVTIAWERWQVGTGLREKLSTRVSAGV